jgi:hypothetical protein
MHIAGRPRRARHRVDTHKDTHTAAVMTAATGAVLEQVIVSATPGRLPAAAEAGRPPSRPAAVGNRRHRRRWCWPDPLPGRSRRAVVELDRPKRTGRRHGARSDPLDATRAARKALGRDQLAQPRAPGQRAALQVRLTARRAAVQAALRALDRRIHLLDAEIADHTRAITSLVRAWPPDLLGRCGVARSWPPPCCGPGPILAAAAQMLPLPCWAAPHHPRVLRPDRPGAPQPFRGAASATRPAPGHPDQTAR